MSSAGRSLPHGGIGSLPAVLALLVPLMYLDSVVDGMLKGLGQQMHSMAYNVVDSSLRVVMIYFLIPLMGIHGYIVVLYASEIFNFTLSLGRLMKVADLRPRLWGWIIKPLFCVALPGFLLGKLSPLLAPYLSSDVARVVLAISLTVLSYFALLRLTGSLRQEDITWMKEILSLGRRRKDNPAPSAARTERALSAALGWPLSCVRPGLWSILSRLHIAAPESRQETPPPSC